MTEEIDFDAVTFFCNELKTYQVEFMDEISSTHKPLTIKKYNYITNSWIEFLECVICVSDYEQINVALANSKFRSELQNHQPDILKEYSIKYIKKCLFEFCTLLNADGKCISDKVLNSLA